MRKFIIIFLILSLVSFCQAAIVQVAILADLHASVSGSTDGARLAAQDGNYVRVFSNWSERLTEFTTAAKLYNADRMVLLGDIVHSLDDNQVATLGVVCNQIEAEAATVNIPIHIIPGNHDCLPTGIAMLLHEFQGTIEGQIVSTNLPSVPAGSKWPNTPVAKKYVSYISNGVNFRYIHLWGAAGGADEGWDVVDPANYAYEDTADKITRPVGAIANQINWLDNKALDAVATPMIIFCHESLAHRNGTATIDADILAQVQADLADEVVAGRPVNAFGGHYHRVFPTGDDLHTLRKDTISGVNYYGLRGSVLAKNATDMRGNTFYIVDVDTVLGVTNVKTFQYSNAARDRYNPFDIDAISGTDTRRDRY